MNDNSEAANKETPSSKGKEHIVAGIAVFPILIVEQSISQHSIP